jgi:hypothetical protein
MIRIRSAFCAALLVLAGCGGPPAKLDTSTDATTEASLKAMTDDMTEAEKNRFREDCKIATIGDQFTSTPPKGDAPKEKLRSLNGLTADEIRTRAAALRVKLSQ